MAITCRPGHSQLRLATSSRGANRTAAASTRRLRPSATRAARDRGRARSQGARARPRPDGQPQAQVGIAAHQEELEQQDPQGRAQGLQIVGPPGGPLGSRRPPGPGPRRGKNSRKPTRRGPAGAQRAGRWWTAAGIGPGAGAPGWGGTGPPGWWRAEAAPRAPAARPAGPAPPRGPRAHAGGRPPDCPTRPTGARPTTPRPASAPDPGPGPSTPAGSAPGRSWPRPRRPGRRLGVV